MKTAVTAVVIALMAASMASGSVRAYAIDPVRADWSGKADPEDGVGQVLTINFDQLDSASGAYCELFAGSKGAGGQYQVAVKTYPGGLTVGSGVADGHIDHKWAKFKIGMLYPESIVKGKQLEFRFTRSGSDSIQYYFQDSANGGPYRHGQMIVGGSYGA